MRWIRIAPHGQAHAVFRSGDKKTACGIALTRAIAIVIPEADRCGNCDRHWREAGRLNKPKRKTVRRDEYNPRYKFEDA